jgi:anti-sigma factor RsiW
MTCAESALLIDDYVDGACDTVTAASVRHHLVTCTGCRALVDDLERIRAAAGALGPIAPPAHVWAGIEAAVRPDARNTPRGGWQLLAAAAGFVLIASSLSWLGSQLPMTPGGARVADTVTAEQYQLAEAAYQSAIDELESIATQGEAPSLTEPAFVALRASLVELDDAIGEAQDRLSQEPDDEISQENLLAALDNKITLLQDAVALLDQERTDIEESNP